MTKPYVSPQEAVYEGTPRIPTPLSSLNGSNPLLEKIGIPDYAITIKRPVTLGLIAVNTHIDDKVVTVAKTAARYITRLF